MVMKKIVKSEYSYTYYKKKKTLRKPYTCKWCGKQHYRGSLVSTQHQKLLKQHGYKKSSSKVEYEKTIYLRPYKIKYGFWKWKGKYFVEINKVGKQKKDYTIKRWYFLTHSMMMKKVNSYKKKIKKVQSYKGK